jgi:wyosine [tRNA(Phe)-imidazoG37] synthetase (radical SAM superfamily)
MKSSHKYIYGPVSSWRTGVSLGLDPLASTSKACNFDCVYCQLGKTSELTTHRKVFVPTNDLLEEVKSLSWQGPLDYLTFSGLGEPTLAQNLGAMIRGLRGIRREPIAVITNSSLMHLSDVRQDLCLADFVIAKLDADSQSSFDSIDGAGHLDFQIVVEGMINFRKIYKGKMALQIMLIKENLHLAQSLSKIAAKIGAQEVQLNTPLRPSGVKPLGPREIDSAKSHFQGFDVVTVFEGTRKICEPMDEDATVRRHGHFRAGVLGTMPKNF